MANFPQLETGVLASDVGMVVQSFITNDGATKVTATKEPGKDTWKVVAE
jgi:hypothetical protein